MSSGDRFICGLEIHQQLDTGKLFCSCDSELAEDGREVCSRRLIPTAGESGVRDRAAVAEFEKQLTYRYRSPSRSSCLVELDEEPPKGPDNEALDIVLTFAAMVGAKIVDEIHFMRKTVIDGSAPGGFQRTAIIGTDGSIDVSGRKIRIESICLEEDSSRKVEEKEGEITYLTDRLCIPLIEIATGPDIRTSEEAYEAALKIGTMLRATRKVKRGIGTIREDVNISVPGSGRTEIKGVQELRLLPMYVENEVQRHLMLIRIGEILSSRKISIDKEITDVTDIFGECRSKVMTSSLSNGGKVLAVRLGGFAGVLNGDSGKLRLGSELALYARTKGVKGIFHSDELPAYGIEKEHVDAVKECLKLKEYDAFVLCAEKEKKARSALETVIERATEALNGVAEETRDPLPDGTSRYSRPLPGAARMRPETDIPPVPITQDRLKRIYGGLPELPEETVKRFIMKYKLNEQQASQIVKEGYDGIFEKVAEDRDMISAAAATFIGTFTEMEREGTDVSSIQEDKILDIFSYLKRSKFAKEALPSVFREVAKGTSIDDAIFGLDLGSMSEEDAAKIIGDIVNERRTFVIEKGVAATGPLMGPMMEALRGKIDGKRMNEILTAEIKKIL